MARPLDAGAELGRLAGSTPAPLDAEAELARLSAPSGGLDAEAELSRLSGTDAEAELEKYPKVPETIQEQSARGYAPMPEAPDLSASEVELRNTLAEYNRRTNHPDPDGDALKQAVASRRSYPDKTAKFSPFFSEAMAEAVKSRAPEGGELYRAAEAFGPKWYGEAADIERRHYWRAAEVDAERQLGRAIYAEFLVEDGMDRAEATRRAQVRYETGAPLPVPTSSNPKYSAGYQVDLGVRDVPELRNTVRQGAADVVRGGLDAVSELANVAKDVVVDAPLATVEATTGWSAPRVQKWEFGSAADALIDALPEGPSKRSLEQSRARGAGWAAGMAELRNAALTPLGVDPVDPDGDGIMDVLTRLQLAEPLESEPAPRKSGTQIAQETVARLKAAPSVTIQGYKDLLSGARPAEDVVLDTLSSGFETWTAPAMDALTAVTQQPGARGRETATAWFMRVPATALSGVGTTWAARAADYALTRWGGAVSGRRNRVPGNPDPTAWEAFLPPLFTANGRHDYYTEVYNGDGFTSEGLRLMDTASTLPWIDDETRMSLRAGRYRRFGTQVGMFADILVPVDSLPIETIRGVRVAGEAGADVYRAKAAGMDTKEALAFGAARAAPSLTHRYMMDDPDYAAAWAQMEGDDAATQPVGVPTTPLLRDEDAVKTAAARAFAQKAIRRGWNPAAHEQGMSRDRADTVNFVREVLTSLKVRPEDVERAIGDLPIDDGEPTTGSPLPTDEADALVSRADGAPEVEPLGRFTEAVTGSATPRDKVEAGMEEIAAHYGTTPDDPLLATAFQAALSWYDPKGGGYKRAPEVDERLLARLTDADVDRALNRLRDATPEQVFLNARTFLLGGVPRWADERIPNRARVRSELLAQVILGGENPTLTKGMVDTALTVLDRIADALVEKGVLPDRDAWYARQTWRPMAEGDPGAVRGKAYIDLAQDASAVIALARDADLSTLFHESAHLLRAVLPAEHMAAVDGLVKERFGGWTRDAEEWFARQMEAILTTGRLSVVKGDGIVSKWADAVQAALRYAAQVLVKLYEGRAFDEVHPTFAKWMEDFAGLKLEEVKAKADPPVVRPPKVRAGKVMAGVSDKWTRRLLTEARTKADEALAKDNKAVQEWLSWLHAALDEPKDIRAKRHRIAGKDPAGVVRAVLAAGERVVADNEARGVYIAETYGPEPVPVVEPAPAPAPHDVQYVFKTALGSTYEVHGDGTTTRVKAKRADHPDSGLMERSQVTVYVTYDHARELAIFQAIGGGYHKKSFQVFGDDQGAIFGVGPDGKLAGLKTSVGRIYRTPAVGLLPVETWLDGRKVHFGNPIVDVRANPATTTPTAMAPPTAAPEWQPAYDALVATATPAAALKAATALLDAVNAPKDRRVSFLAAVKIAVKERRSLAPLASDLVADTVGLPEAAPLPPRPPVLPDELVEIPEPEPSPLPEGATLPKQGTPDIDAYGQPRALVGGVPFRIRKARLADLVTEGVAAETDALARTFDMGELDPTGADPGVGAPTVVEQDGKLVVMEGHRRVQALKVAYEKGMAGEEPYIGIMAGVQARMAQWAPSLGMGQLAGDEILVRDVTGANATQTKALVKADAQPAVGLDVMGLLPEDLATAANRAGAPAQERLAAGATAIARLAAVPGALQAIRDGTILYGQVRTGKGPPARWASQVRKRWVAVAGTKVLPVSQASVHVATAMGALSAQDFAAWLDQVADTGRWARTDADAKAVADLPADHGEALEYARRLEMEAIEAAEAEKPVVTEPPGFAEVRPAVESVRAMRVTPGTDLTWGDLSSWILAYRANAERPPSAVRDLAAFKHIRALDDATVKAGTATDLMALTSIIDGAEEYAKANKQNTYWTARIRGAIQDAPAMADVSSGTKVLFQDRDEKVTKGRLGADQARLIDLLGATMYSKPLVQVTVKELVQNAFDATKAAEDAGKIDHGIIDVVMNGATRTITVRDNGAGMTPEIVQKALFTIAGTNKEGLRAERRSGGLGLAKMAFLFGSDWIEVSTVRNGTRTFVRATSDQIKGSDFEIRTTKGVREKNGTTITVRIPEDFYDANKGERVPINFYSSQVTGPYGGFLGEPLVGNAEVRFHDTYDADYALESATSAQVLPIGRNWPMDGIEKFTTAKFDWGEADIYIGTNRSQRPKHKILSSGLYQFDTAFMNPRTFERIPYDIVVNVQPKVEPTHPSYPFNNQREYFRATVKPDIDALSNYLLRYASGLEAKSTADTFKSAVPMERRPMQLIGGDLGAARDALLAGFTKAADAPERAPEDAAPPEIVVTRDTVTERRPAAGGVMSERVLPATFKAEKEVDAPSSFMDTVKVDPTKPLFHNNTTIDYVKAARTVNPTAEPEAFFTDIGSIVVEFKERVAEVGGYGFETLNDAASPYAAGVSVDKGYRGVHVKVPYRAFFLNPLGARGKGPIGVSESMLHTLVHEAAHTRVMAHDESFALAVADLYSSMADSADIQAFRDALEATVAKHWETFVTLRDLYERSSTQNLGKSLEDGAKLRTEAASDGGAGGAGAAPVAGAGGGTVGGAAGAVRQGDRDAGAGGSGGPGSARDVIVARLTGDTAKLYQHRDYTESVLPKTQPGDPIPAVPDAPITAEKVGRDEPIKFKGASPDKPGVTTPYGMRGARQRAIPAFTTPSQLNRALGYRADQTTYNARDLAARAYAYALITKSQARRGRSRFVKVGNLTAVPAARAAAVRARGLAILGDVPRIVADTVRGRAALPAAAVPAEFDVRRENQPIGLSLEHAGRIRTILDALDANGWADSLPKSIATMRVQDIAERMTTEQYNEIVGAVMDSQSGVAPYRGRVDRYSMAANLVWEFAQRPGGWFTPVPLERDAPVLHQKVNAARSWIGALILSTAYYLLPYDEVAPDMRPDIRPAYERMRREQSQLASRLAESLEWLLEQNAKGASPGVMQAELLELSRALPGAVPPIGVVSNGDGRPSDLHQIREWLYLRAPSLYGIQTQKVRLPDGTMEDQYVPHDLPRFQSRPVLDVAAEVVQHAALLNRILNPPGRRTDPGVVGLLNRARNGTIDHEDAKILFGEAWAALNAAKQIGIDVLVAAAGHSGAKDRVADIVRKAEKEGAFSGIALDAYDAFYRGRWTRPAAPAPGAPPVIDASVEALIRTLGVAPKAIPAPFWVFDVLNRLNHKHLADKFRDDLIDRDFVFDLTSMARESGRQFGSVREMVVFGADVSRAVDAELAATDYHRGYGVSEEGIAELGSRGDVLIPEDARYMARVMMAKMGLAPDLLATRKGIKGSVTANPTAAAWLTLSSDPVELGRQIVNPDTWRDAGRRFGLHGHDAYLSAVVAEAFAEMAERNAPLAERLAAVLSNRESYGQMFDVVRDLYAQLKGSFITGGPNGILIAATVGASLAAGVAGGAGFMAIPQAAAMAVAVGALSLLPRASGFVNNTVGALFQGALELGATGVARTFLSSAPGHALRAARQSVKFHTISKAVDAALAAVQSRLPGMTPPENVAIVTKSGMVYTVADVMTISRRYGLDETQARSEAAETIRRRVDRLYAEYEADPSMAGQMWRRVERFFGRWRITENYRRMYEQVDVFFRYTWLIRGLQDGLRPEDAVARALRISFDYTATSQVDRWINLIGMFWMYQRRAIDLTITAAVEHPHTVFGMIRAMRAQDLTSGYADVNEDYERESETTPDHLLGKFAVGYLPVGGGKNAAAKLALVELPATTALRFFAQLSTGDPMLVMQRLSPVGAVMFNEAGTTMGGPILSMFRGAPASTPGMWKVPMRFVRMDQALNGGALTNLYDLQWAHGTDPQEGGYFYVGPRGRMAWDATRQLLPGMSTWLTEGEKSDRADGFVDQLVVDVLDIVQAADIGLSEVQHRPDNVMFPAVDVKPRPWAGQRWEGMSRYGVAPGMMPSPEMVDLRTQLDVDAARRARMDELRAQLAASRPELEEGKAIKGAEPVDPNRPLGMEPDKAIGLQPE